MFVPSIARAAVRLTFFIAGSFLLTACQEAPRTEVPTAGPPEFVGTEYCAGCHEVEHQAWQASHHALAMMVASDETVLGEFADVSIEAGADSARFFRDGARFMVETTGADGNPASFQITHTFGVDPLQQYLVEIPGGKLQSFPFAWDSRPAANGGQRWFHLYPDEQISPGDVLHWTGREQNWNYQCAECHSTALEKNYDVTTDSYATRWFEINVGCEGCHGPGSRHVAQVEAEDLDSVGGFAFSMDDRGRTAWVMNMQTGIAERSETRMRPPVQPEACGRCHSRRSVITDDYQHGRPLLDTHTPALLDAGLYYADGQIRDEVYVYASFLQSRMYQAGVSCSDCHEPHAATIRSAGEPSEICATCHLPAVFSVEAHHHHPAEANVSCVDCHMTSTNYMVIDGRRDHSFRIPRPDLSVATGAPNACAQCHVDEGDEWSLARWVEWYGEPDSEHYAHALHAGRQGIGNAALIEAIGNDEFPGIVRATALTLLRPPHSQVAAETIRRSLGSGDPLVRLGALRGISGLQPDVQVDWAAPLLRDSVRSLRIAAARVLSPFRNRLRPADEGAFRIAIAELAESYEAIAERPEAQSGIGALYVDAGDAPLAEASYRTALRLYPQAVGPRINLSDLYRRTGRDADAESLLRDAISEFPDEGAYHHALGLALVRQQQPEAGLDALARAAELDPDNARYVYVHAIALNSLGQADAAVARLSAAADLYPGDFDIHWGLATILRDQGRTERALEVAVKLAEAYPGVPPLEQFLTELR